MLDTPIPTALPSTNDRVRPANDPSPRRNWLREPLLHFFVLGGLLFAADHYLFTQTDDPRTIVIGADVDADAIQLFKSSRGRAPTPEELNALRQVWLDNEVLYREGIALQVDKGDTAIRERVIFKALSVVDANVKLPPADDGVLRKWFEARRAKYDEPARFDFQEAVLSGDTSETAVRAFVDALNAGTPGDARAGLRVFKGRPRTNLEASYGPAFANALDAARTDTWQATPTRDGWRAIRLDAKSQARPADYERVRNVVVQDWTDATLSEQRSAAVRAMTHRYKVVNEGAKP